MSIVKYYESHYVRVLDVYIFWWPFSSESEATRPYCKPYKHNLSQPFGFSYQQEEKHPASSALV